MTKQIIHTNEEYQNEKSIKPIETDGKILYLP
jgi:hypothetical protein